MTDRFKVQPTAHVRIHSNNCLGRVCDYCGICDLCSRVIQSPPHIAVCACKGDVKHHHCGDCVNRGPALADRTDAE